MTEAPARKKRAPDLRHGAAICGSIFLLALILRNTEAAISFMRRGIGLCTETVIPSLFPFMVISTLLIESGTGEWAGRLFAGHVRRIFGISGASACAVLLGALCGFPIGAKSAVELYDRGAIDRAELEHLLTFCNNTSSAFVISAIGTSLWSSYRFGVGLFWIQLGCSILIGWIGRSRGRSTQLCPAPAERRSGTEIFTRAITSSASGMLAVCAYVTFFSAVVGTLGVLLDRISTSPIIDALLFGFFELSSGVNAAAALEDPYAGAVLTAFAVGWSGLSVHFQIMSLTAGREIAYRPYLLAKGAQGLLCAAITAIWLKLAPPHDLLPCAAAETFRALPGAFGQIVCLVFCAALVYTGFILLRNKNFGKIR